MGEARLQEATSSPQGGGVSVTKPGGWRRSQGEGQRAEEWNIVLQPSGPSAGHRAPAMLYKRRAGPERQSGLPGSAELAGSCAEDSDPPGASEGAHLDTRPTPSTGTCSSLSLWLSGQCTGDTGWYPVPPHSTISPLLLRPLRMGGGPRLGRGEAQAPTSGITHDRLPLRLTSGDTRAHTGPNAGLQQLISKGTETDALHVGGDAAAASAAHAPPWHPPSGTTGTQPHPHGTALPITTLTVSTY